MTGRTYGTLTRVESGDWLINPEAHVAMRLRRIFPRVRSTAVGLVLGDTPEIAADLEWVMLRWPFVMTGQDAEHLAARADRYRESRDTVMRILAGYVPPAEWRDTAIPARSYQLEAAAVANETGRLLLADDVGLGKTLSGLLLLRNPDALPALVVTLTHLPAQWEREVRRFLPWLSPHVVRNGPVYDPLSGQHDLFDPTADVLIMNYHKLSKWADYLKGVVRTVVFDEAQELRRSDSNKYEAALMIAREAQWRVGLTATPVYNYGGEIWNIVNVLGSDVLGSREEFLREWCGWGGGEKAAVREPKALGSYLRDEGVMLRRTRRDVGRELPDVIRVPHNVDVDAEQLDAMTSDAVDLAKRILTATGSNFDLMRASGDLDWRLRHATGVSKAPYVAEFVRMLVESGEPVVLFGWHRSVYDIWTEKLTKHLPRPPAMYTGSETPTKKQHEADRFLSGDTDVLIMSLRAGAGLDGLQERSSVCVFGELDWSPGVHTQAIGRLHRDGQPNPVVAYFLVADSGADPPMAEVLNLKAQQADPILDPDADSVIAGAPDADRVKRLAAEFLRQRGVTL